MGRVIFINRFYWPEEPATSQLLTDLAEQLASKGELVSVITSHPGDQGIPKFENHQSVTILRVGSSRLGKTSVIRRFIDFVGFIGGASWNLLRHTSRGDTVVFMTDPPLLAALTWPIVSLRGANFIHWVQDIYPEIAIELVGHRWLKIFTPLRNWSWRKASACVTLGKDMAQVIENTGVPSCKIKVIPNWSPAEQQEPSLEDVAELQSRWELEGKFIALYSGNLGRVHDLDPLLEIATLLRGDPNIVFVIVGSGAQLDSLKSAAKSRELANVHFFPPQPRDKLSVTLALGNIHFVTLRPGCENYVFPSKFHGITAAGRPIIYIGPDGSELFDIVEKNKLGYSFTRKQIPEIAQSIQQMQQTPESGQSFAKEAHSYSEERDMANAVASWNQLLKANLALPTNEGELVS